MFGFKIFVRVQTFRRVPPVLPCNFSHPAPGIYTSINADLKFDKSLTPVILQKKSILSEKKRVNRNIFGQGLRFDEVFLVYLDQIVSFCAIIRSNTNPVKLLSENSSLNSANFKVSVMFCVGS